MLEKRGSMQRVKSIPSSRQTHLPAIEWSSMRHLLGDAALAQLVGTSEASLLRFAQGQRATPRSVGQRLHWLAMVAADLAGSYNETGIRRWFERPRQQLNGKSPKQFLKANWTPRSREAIRIRELSAGLIGDRSFGA